MSKDLKEPFRFSHDSVTEHFKQLMNEMKKYGFNNFGSSGDGEITIQGERGSVYVRKYRRNDTWRLIFRLEGKVSEPIFKSTMKDVVDEIVHSVI